MASKLIPTKQFVCASCRYSQAGSSLTFLRPTRPSRFSSSSSTARASQPTPSSDPNNSPQKTSSEDATLTSQKTDSSPDKEKGALYRRLEQATEDALTSGGRAGWRAVEDAGFSEELKAKLYDKVAAAKLNSVEGVGGVNIAPGAGAGTRLHADGKHWTGEESHEDAALRMLDDSKRKLPPELRGRSVVAPPTLGRVGGGQVGKVKRAAAARELASSYRIEGKGLTEGEREEFLRELRERFQPGARALPNTISGLASLANERYVAMPGRGVICLRS